MELLALTCISCCQPFVLGRECYRGQQFCSPICRSEKRRESLRAAGANYQGTGQGRRNHNERQNQYRKRSLQAEAKSIAKERNVTHHTSRKEAEAVMIPVDPPKVRIEASSGVDAEPEGATELGHDRQAIARERRGCSGPQSNQPRCGICGRPGWIVLRELRPGAGRRGCWIRVERESG